MSEERGFREDSIDSSHDGTKLRIKRSRTTPANSRTSWSCIECTRRKIKCDKVVPCMQCTKRGQGDACRRAPQDDTPPQKYFPTELGPLPQPLQRVATQSELDNIRLVASGLKQRVFHLESLIASFYPSRQDADGAPVEFALPPPGINVATQAFAAPAHLQDSSYAAEWQPVNSELHASIQLEKLALGWQQDHESIERNHVSRAHATGHTSQDASHGGPLISAFHSSLPSFSGRHATSNHRREPLEAVVDLLSRLPSPSQREAILTFSLEKVSWQHGGVVHNPTFLQEKTEFDAWTADEQAARVNPAWLSLYFALLCAGVRQLDSDSIKAAGLRGKDLESLPKRYFDAAMDSLVLSNFMEFPTFFALQTICVFFLVIQDVASLNLISNLLATGIRICQHMGLHKLGSDSVWLVSQEKKGISMTSPQGIQNLISRELSKRVWYGFVCEDLSWYSRHHFCAIDLKQCTTPVPNNTHNDDLSQGLCLSRPMEEPTVASKTIMHQRLATCMRDATEAAAENADSPEGLLKHCRDIDASVQNILSAGPSYLRSGVDISHLPPYVASFRRWWQMCLNHKALLVHRAILMHRYTDPQYLEIRKAALAAAQTTLLEFTKRSHFPFQHVWTCVSHALAAATYILLEMYQPLTDLNNLSPLIKATITVLHSFEVPSSVFLPRGIPILEALLTEHNKRHGDPSHKRKFDSGNHSETSLNPPIYPDRRTSDDNGERQSSSLDAATLALVMEKGSPKPDFDYNRDFGFPTSFDTNYEAELLTSLGVGTLEPASAEIPNWWTEMDNQFIY